MRKKTIADILGRVRDARLPEGVNRELVVVNDCSADRTEEEVSKFKAQNPSVSIAYFKHEVNKGKGAALSYGY